MPNKIRFGKWQEVKFLEQGGQGKVYLVRDTESGCSWDTLRNSIIRLTSARHPLEYVSHGEEFARQVWDIAHAPHTFGACKVMLPFEEGAGKSNAEARRRIIQELAILGEVSHPSIVRLLDSDPDAHWFVMEYLSGGKLSDQLARYKGRTLKALMDFRQLVDAVQVLHSKKIIHRDIKPENIFVHSDGRLVLGDCGLAFREPGKDRLSLTYENVGSRDFQPPWSYGKRLLEVKPSFDVFALAKLLWVMISGRPMLQLWYFNRSENDLSGMFPTDPSIRYVNDILERCLVEFEDSMLLQSATELLSEVDTAIAAISHGCQIPSNSQVMSRSMKCRFCGIGTYAHQGEHALFGPMTTSDEKKFLRCKHCGHIEMFSWPSKELPLAWRGS